MTNPSCLSRFRHDPLLAGHIPGGEGEKKTQQKNNPKRKKKQHATKPRTQMRSWKKLKHPQGISGVGFFSTLLLTPYGFSLPAGWWRTGACSTAKPWCCLGRLSPKRRRCLKEPCPSALHQRRGSAWPCCDFLTFLQLSARFGSVCSGVSIT